MPQEFKLKIKISVSYVIVSKYISRIYPTVIKNGAICYKET